MNVQSLLRGLRQRWLEGRPSRHERRHKSRRITLSTIRLRVEDLEDRTLLAVIPAANVVQGSQITLPSSGSSSPSISPAVAVDPTNPLKMVVISGLGTNTSAPATSGGNTGLAGSYTVN